MGRLSPERLAELDLVKVTASIAPLPSPFVPNKQGQADPDQIRFAVRKSNFAGPQWMSSLGHQRRPLPLSSHLQYSRYSLRVDMVQTDATGSEDLELTVQWLGLNRVAMCGQAAVSSSRKPIRFKLNLAVGLPVDLLPEAAKATLGRCHYPHLLPTELIL